MASRPAPTRDALLDAALELLDQGGRAAVTLREVGRRAGVSHNAPYKHFANKEALLAAVAARELRRRGARMSEVVAQAKSPEEALAVALREQVAAAVAHPERARLIYGRWTTATATDELVDAAHAASELTIETVRAAQARGALPPGDPDHLAAMLRAMSRGAAELEAAGHLAPDGKGRSDAAGLIDSLLGYLDPRRTRPA